MRVTLTASICVGLCALIVCIYALVFVSNAIGEIERLRLEALELVEYGRYAPAREKLIQLAARWQRHTPVLEMISSHDDVHEVSASILDAEVCMEAMDVNDLLRVLEQLRAALEHIYSIQQVNLRNLY